MFLSQVGGLPVPWIQRLPVPVWGRWLQTLQRFLRLPASDPVHASYQGHAVPPERMLQLHLRQQVNDTCWLPGTVVAIQPSQIFSSSNAPCLQFFLKYPPCRSIQRKDRMRINTRDNLNWLFIVLKINMLWKTSKTEYICSFHKIV